MPRTFNIQNFDIQNSRDCLKDLRDTISDFKKDSLNPRIARYGAIVAWSICEWVFEEHGSRLGYKKKELDKLQEDIRNACPELEYLQDLANFLKHKTITKYTPSLYRAYKKKGAFSQGFSRDFDISSLMLELNDGRKLWFEDVIEKALSFWEEYFKKHGI